VTTGWVIDTEPSQRFPVYTPGDTGEVFPDVMSSLTGSLIGTRRLMGRSGPYSISAAGRCRPGRGSLGSRGFCGHLFGTLSMMRGLCERAPGMTADDAVTVLSDRSVTSTVSRANVNHDRRDQDDRRGRPERS
jgi:hypothetical protein